ncbi:hypothetical protein Ciccas_002367 [Cichlidogyrus casuarinus]|uniref:CARD domain-containing protein n=1 Tax=Cichlidogyrus casuarinus TaxID=1844966 RepID=A0ABD2QI24_9PLAT
MALLMVEEAEENGRGIERSWTYTTLRAYKHLILDNIQTSELMLAYLRETQLLSPSMCNDIREIPFTETRKRGKKLLNYLGVRITSPDNLALFCDILKRCGHQILAAFISGEVGNFAPQDENERPRKTAAKLAKEIVEYMQTDQLKNYNMRPTKEARHKMTRRVSEQLEHVLTDTYVRALGSQQADKELHSVDNVVQLRLLRKQLQQKESQVERLSEQLKEEQTKSMHLQTALRDCHAELTVSRSRMLKASDPCNEEESALLMFQISQEIQQLSILKARVNTVY